MTWEHLGQHLVVVEVEEHQKQLRWAPRNLLPPKKTGAAKPKPKAPVKNKQATYAFDDDNGEETDSNSMVIK